MFSFGVHTFPFGVLFVVPLTFLALEQPHHQNFVGRERNIFFFPPPPKVSKKKHKPSEKFWVLAVPLRIWGRGFFG